MYSSMYFEKLIQAYLILLCFTLLHFTDVVFLQIEGKTLHQQKDYNSLCCSGLEPNPQCLRGVPAELCGHPTTEGEDIFTSFRWSSMPFYPQPPNPTPAPGSWQLQVRFLFLLVHNVMLVESCNMQPLESDFLHLATKLLNSAMLCTYLFIPFYCWIVFHYGYVDISQLIFPFSIWLFGCF